MLRFHSNVKLDGIDNNEAHFSDWHFMTSRNISILIEMKHTDEYTIRNQNKVIVLADESEAGEKKKVGE